MHRLRGEVCVRRVIFLVLLTVGAASAHAMRFSFVVVDSSGREVDGAEVCATRAATGGVAHWLGDEQIRCYPSTTVLAFPPGHWAVYAVKHGQYVSTHPYFIPVKGDPSDTDTGFKKIQIPVTDAVSVQLQSGSEPLSAGSRAVLYFPGTSSWMTFSTPIPAGQATATVPRGAAFLAFLVSAGQVEQIARPRWAADRSSATVLFEPAPKVSVIAAVRHSRLTGELASAHELPAPSIFMTTGDGTKFESRVSYRTMGDGDLVLFEDVPPGARDAVVHVTGPTYERVEEPFRIDASSGHVVAGPSVTVTPAAQLRVSLSVDASDFLRGAVADCGPNVTPGRLKEWSVVLDGCGGVAECRKIERCGIDALLADGEVRYDEVTVGTYDLAVVNPRGTAMWREKIVARAGTSSVLLAPPLSRVVGKVTRAGAPAHVRVQVADGKTTTADDGTYSVIFAAGREPAQLDVITCDVVPEPYTFFPQSPLTNMATFDIELPEPVVVRVVEIGAGTGIPGARLSVTTAERSPHSTLHTQLGSVTDREGRSLLRNPPSGRKFLVCAKAADYEESCGEPADGELTLALTKVSAEDGRIEGVAGVQNGMVYFVTASGETTEAAAVASDGAFKFRRPHGPQEYALFISRNQPLAAMAVPPAGAARLTLPRGRVRSLTIRSSSVEDYEVGLALGDLIIPSAVLSRHQAFRGASTYTQGGQLVLREFIESARPIVYRGYSLTNRPPTIPVQVDVFTRPELRRGLVSRPAEGDVVSFD
jgi:hypothetical protein